jgi:hypothetical protein
MNDNQIRIECLRLAMAIPSASGYVGNQMGMMSTPLPAVTADQIRARAQVFYDFATGKSVEPAPTPVKIGDKLVVVGG